MTMLPLQLEMKIQPLRGILVKSSSDGHASTAASLHLDANPVITPRALCLEASQSSRITISVASGLRAWFCGPNQDTVHLMVLWANHQTPRASFGLDPVPCSAPCSRL